MSRRPLTESYDASFGLLVFFALSLESARSLNFSKVEKPPANPVKTQTPFDNVENFSCNED